MSYQELVEHTQRFYKLSVGEFSAFVWRHWNSKSKSV